MKKIVYLFLTLLIAGCSFAHKPSPAPTPSSESQPTSIPTPLPLDHQSFDSLYVIINKQYPLTKEYEPSDLVVPDVLSTRDGLTLRQDAATALEEMFFAASEDGISLRLGSGYRSYATQERLYNNYVSRDGEEAANRYSARPGQSEHQTGWAVDISDSSMKNWLKNSFKSTPEGQWLRENSYKYGYVLRFLENKEDITGYIYEPWHFRYIGIEEAEQIYNSELTLEEFYSYND